MSSVASIDLHLIHANVPAGVRDGPQWVTWKYIERDGKPTKSPINPHTGEFASSTDASTWGTFDEAIAACSRDSGLAGVGFVFTGDDPYSGVDLDDCRDPESGQLKEWAREIVEQLASYSEVSPSGTGVKVFVQAVKPGSRCRKAYHDGEVEIYDRDRFFTVTGEHVSETPASIEARQEQLDALYLAVFGDDGHSDGPLVSSGTRSPKPSNNGHIHLDDDEIVQLASNQRRSGAKFSALWSGDWNSHFNSASEADSSVVFTLAFYSKDASQIDRLFRRSGLMRPKWDEQHGEQTYGEMTVAKALSKVTKQYKPKGKRKRPRPQAPPPAKPGLPSILIDDRQLSDLTDEAMAAVALANSPPSVFVRAGTLTRVVKDEHGQPKIESFDRARVRCRLSEVANFFTMRKGEDGFEPVGTNPPIPLAENVLALGRWNLPPLVGITRAPILRTDGTICTAPGYDALSQLMYCPDPGLSLTPIPEYPDSNETQACVDILLNLIGEFPFADDASRANALAILFSILMRPVIAGHVPMAIVDAPVQGTGKTLLVTALATIAVGNVAAESIPTKQNEDEWRKKITSILLAASPFVMLENIPDNTNIDSPSLAAALTSNEWSDRLLGRNETIRLPARAVWAATGNNLRVTGDMPRRSYSIRLDANIERPWERTGFHIKELESHVKTQRGDLLSAALTVIRAWYTNGKPQANVPTLGSFEEWANTVGSVLAFAGVPEFLGNLSQTQIVQDDDTQQWRVFFSAWWDRFERHEVAASDICSLVLPPKDTITQAVDQEFLDALPEPFLVNRDRGEGSLKRSIGRQLSRLTGRIFDNRKLCGAGKNKSNHVRKWKLEPMAGAGAEEAPKEEFV
jgi:hypothetical protein